MQCFLIIAGFAQKNNFGNIYSPVPNKANIQNKTNIGPDSQKLIKLTYGIKANIGPVLQKLIKLTYRIKN